MLGTDTGDVAAYAVAPMKWAVGTGLIKIKKLQQELFLWAIDL